MLYPVNLSMNGVQTHILVVIGADCTGTAPIFLITSEMGKIIINHDDFSVMFILWNYVRLDK